MALENETTNAQNGKDEDLNSTLNIQFYPTSSDDVDHDISPEVTPIKIRYKTKEVVDTKFPTILVNRRGSNLDTIKRIINLSNLILEERYTDKILSTTDLNIRVNDENKDISNYTTSRNFIPRSQGNDLTFSLPYLKKRIINVIGNAIKKYAYLNDTVEIHF